MAGEIEKAPPISGLSIAMQWAQLPPEHLSIALAALEPQLQREHELDKLKAEVELQAQKERNSHVLYLTGLYMGFAIVLFMLAGAVISGLRGNTVLACSLGGPCILPLAAIFVLRKGAKHEVRNLAAMQNQILNTMGPPAV